MCACVLSLCVCVKERKAERGRERERGRGRERAMRECVHAHVCVCMCMWQACHINMGSRIHLGLGLCGLLCSLLCSYHHVCHHADHHGCDRHRHSVGVCWSGPRHWCACVKPTGRRRQPKAPTLRTHHSKSACTMLRVRRGCRCVCTMHATGTFARRWVGMCVQGSGEGGTHEPDR